MIDMKTVGIFDSGIGGERFASELTKVHPEYKTTVVHDRTHLPFGNKTSDQIIKYTEDAIRPLLTHDVIVLACNTATAYAIEYLRTKYPNQKFVGFEPAIKTAAAHTKTNVIAVLATSATLKSTRYQNLKRKYAPNATIIEPDVSLLAHQIENNNVDWAALADLISNLKAQSVDTIVLGCTHYHLIEGQLKKITGSTIAIITPTEAVIRQIETL